MLTSSYSTITCARTSLLSIGCCHSPRHFKVKTLTCFAVCVGLRATHDSCDAHLQLRISGRGCHAKLPLIGRTITFAGPRSRKRMYMYVPSGFFPLACGRQIGQWCISLTREAKDQSGISMHSTFMLL